jgi:hypothetical protein
MAFTTTQLEALESAIGAGELKVTFDGKEVQYRSMDELLKAYEFVRGKLIESGLIADTRVRVSVASFSKE